MFLSQMRHLDFKACALFQWCWLLISRENIGCNYDKLQILITWFFFVDFLRKFSPKIKFDSMLLYPWLAMWPPSLDWEVLCCLLVDFIFSVFICLFVCCFCRFVSFFFKVQYASGAFFFLVCLLCFLFSISL